MFFLWTKNEKIPFWDFSLHIYESEVYFQPNLKFSFNMKFANTIGIFIESFVLIYLKAKILLRIKNLLIPSSRFRFISKNCWFQPTVHSTMPLFIALSHTRAFFSCDRLNTYVVDLKENVFKLKIYVFNKMKLCKITM